MKLNEIFDTEFKERNSADLSKYDKRYSAIHSGELGHGKFSSVKPKKSDPFLVTKVQNKALDSYHGNDPLKQDAYYQYMKYIVDNKVAQSNPFAPRIYKITLFKDTSGKQKYNVDMEKLEPMSSTSMEERAAIKDNLNLPNELKDVYLGDVFDYVIDGVKTGNEHFNAICKIIYNIKESNGNFVCDIHDANYMVRRTAHGLQLVVTDPLAHFTD